MAKWCVSVRAVYAETMEVEADSKHEAIRKAEDGEGEVLERERLHEINSDSWTAWEQE